MGDGGGNEDQRLCCSEGSMNGQVSVGGGGDLAAVTPTDKLEQQAVINMETFDAEESTRLRAFGNRLEFLESLLEHVPVFSQYDATLSVALVKHMREKLEKDPQSVLTPSPVKKATELQPRAVIPTKQHYCKAEKGVIKSFHFHTLVSFTADKRYHCHARVNSQTIFRTSAPSLPATGEMLSHVYGTWAGAAFLVKTATLVSVYKSNADAAFMLDIVGEDEIKEEEVRVSGAKLSLGSILKAKDSIDTILYTLPMAVIREEVGEQLETGSLTVHIEPVYDTT